MQKKISFAAFILFLFALGFGLFLHFLALIYKAINNPEVMTYFHANWDAILEAKSSVDYLFANLRCYFTNLFVSEEIISLDYFD